MPLRLKCIIIMAVSCVLACVLPSCNSAPNEVEIRGKAPGVDVDVKWKRSSTPSPLPSGWTPSSTRTLRLKIDGDTYPVPLCIALNPSVPDCIYANLSGCSATDGWQMYCKEAAVPEGGGGGTGQPIPIEPIEECPTEYGTFAVDLLTGHSSIAFVTGCDNETIPSGLVDVMMTHPNGGMPMPWNVFAAQTGGIMPTGTVVQMSGDKYVIAWNAMLLGRTEAAYTATTGHRVACGIQHGGLEHPPVAVVVVNQQIAEVFFVHEPE